MGASLLARVVRKVGADRLYASLTEGERVELEFLWEAHARPEQLRPTGRDWTWWLVQAGRGFGKTRTGAEAVRAWAKESPGCIIGIAGPTPDAVRITQIEGPAGILAVHPPWERPVFEPAVGSGRLTWPNGTTALVFSGASPSKARGPQFHKLWADELPHWRHPKETHDNLAFGLRLGTNPQGIITTTPLPISVLRKLRKDPACVVTSGTTYENRHNLAASFFAEIVSKYEGTRLGRQEIHGELLEDTPGALWTRSNLDALQTDKVPALVRIVVGVDPAVTSGEDSDLTGIVVAGKGEDGHLYVLADRSMRGTPGEWATAVVEAFHEFKADRVIAEVNNGGDLVEALLRTVDSGLPVRKVTASRGKRTRAEPIAALYEQKRAHHVRGMDALEDQLVTFAPGKSDESPDRMDALVWAGSALMLGKTAVLT